MKNYFKNKWQKEPRFRLVVIALGSYLAYSLFLVPIWMIIDLFKNLFFIYFILGNIMIAVSSFIKVFVWVGIACGIIELIDITKDWLQGNIK